MQCFQERVFVIFVMLCAPLVAVSQHAPATPDRPWEGTPKMQPGVPPRHSPVFVPDPLKIYTLPELVDVAEQNNPETRVAWENAKARAADLGVSKASLYPTLAAVALADTNRSQLFFSPDYFRQTRQKCLNLKDLWLGNPQHGDATRAAGVATVLRRRTQLQPKTWVARIASVP